MIKRWWPLAPSLAFAAAAAAAAAQPSAQPVSLIVGHWLGESAVVGVPCPEDHLCLNVIGDVRLGDVRTLAGPTAPASLTARFEFHALPAVGYDQVLLVRPSAVRGGRFEGISLGRVRRNGRVCVARQTLTGNAVPVPPYARAAGEEICFRRIAGR